VKRPKYGEGDWFAVPLRDGGYATGIIARMNPNGVLLGYFFGPRHDDVPVLADVYHLVAENACLVGKFGHLGLKDGTWPILGCLSVWDRDLWPMPVFVRYEELTGRTFHMYYGDDPNRLVRQVQVFPGAAEQGPKEGLMGYAYVEIVLTRMLQNEGNIGA